MAFCIVKNKLDCCWFSVQYNFTLDFLMLAGNWNWSFLFIWSRWKARVWE